VLLVYCKESPVLSDFHKGLRVLRAARGDHVESREQDGDTLLVPVHLLLVSLSLSLDLLCDSVHEGSYHLVNLLVGVHLVVRAHLKAVLYHSYSCVHLGNSQLNDAKKPD